MKSKTLRTANGRIEPVLCLTAPQSIARIELLGSFRAHIIKSALILVHCLLRGTYVIKSRVGNHITRG